METINIPIYRAKKIDSDEYVEGYYNFTLDSKHILATPFVFEIDPKTLAIHFPNMLDSQENKIFASLSKDGKGGDICEIDFDIEILKGIIIYEFYKIIIDFNETYREYSEINSFILAIGIQK